MGAYNGLLAIDKPRGITSHDAVLAVRRALPPGVKVGHTGTLDPMADGLLLLVLGNATKAAARYQQLPKVYSGRIRLGQETDTGDLDGKIIRESPVPALDAPRLQSAMRAFQRVLEMPPPAYSAVKYKGKPLYAYARKGIQVPLKNRTFEIYEWDLLDWASPELAFRLHCSHGTYARSMAVLLGEAMGCPAVLSGLRRERIGPHQIADALTLDAALRLPLEELARKLLPVSPPTPASVTTGA